MLADKPYDHLEEHVLKTLLYFDIFSYPLRASEILKFLRGRRTCQQEVIECPPNVVAVTPLKDTGVDLERHLGVVMADLRHDVRELGSGREHH